MTRSPPTRAELMASNAIQIANSPLNGYSQKPPSGRWGPDFDCSSLMYFLAKLSGFDVEIGGDKVRFTGTMLKDFEKAGFQILPFANVGVSDLQIGDILLNLALHAEVYVGDGDSVGATSSETGGYFGEAGDQTGHEIERHPVTTFNKGWNYVLRPPHDDILKDESDDVEEGDEQVPDMSYSQPMWSRPNTPMAPMQYAPGNQSGYPQGTRWGSGMGYPQGNLGQMNGYSQASAGYPQSGMQGYQQGMGPEMDLCYVKGIEGANKLMGIPNSRKAVFDDDEMLMYIVEFGPQGTPVDIRVRPFGDEISEGMPQHLSPLMKQNVSPMGPDHGQPQNEYITKTELEQMLKEMLTNAQSSAPTDPNAARTNGATQSANAGRTRQSDATNDI